MAKDFHEREGVNVKTNDSVVKSADGRKRPRGENTRGRGAVTRAVAATRMMTILFYFSRSLVSRRLSTFISTVCLYYFSTLREAPLCGIISRLHVLLHESINVFRDRAIHSYCSRSLSGHCSLKVARFCYYLFTMMAVQGRNIYQVDETLYWKKEILFF